MPTREEKKISHLVWTIWFKLATPLALVRSGSKKVEAANETDDNRRCHNTVQVLAQTARCIELQFANPVKYDNVVAWFFKTSDIPKQHWEVRTALAREAASAQGDRRIFVTTTPSPSQPTVVKPHEEPASDLAFMQLRLLDSLSGQEHEKELERAFREKYIIDTMPLGRGSYGVVYPCVLGGQPTVKLVVKVFTDATSIDAMKEVAALSALPPHPNLPRLLDCRTCGFKQFLVYSRFCSDLKSALGKRGYDTEAARYILAGITAGVRHMHCHGLAHADLTPNNILCRRPALLRNLEGCAGDDWFKRLLAVRSGCLVCVSDLGSARPANPLNRNTPCSSTELRPRGVNLVTQTYRAPELLLGDVGWTSAIDCWALGCILAELFSGQNLFTHSREKDETKMCKHIFELLGAPTDGHLTTLCNYESHTRWLLGMRVTWPPKALENIPIDFLCATSKLLQLDPKRRCTMDELANESVFPAAHMTTILAEVAGGQGPTTIVKGELEPSLLSWLQADPCWETFTENMLRPCAKKSKQCLSHDEAKLKLKYESGGYVAEQPPECSTMGGMSMKEPLQSTRVRKFVSAFRELNRSWFAEVGELIKARLRALPKSNLGCNGQDFLEGDFATNAFAYGMVQVMAATTRRDPLHYDGGCSLLHMGLTIFGSRGLDVWFKDAPGSIRVSSPASASAAALQSTPSDAEQVETGTTELPSETVQMQPGSLYVGNLVAVQHQVVHYAAGDAGQLYRGVHDSAANEAASAQTAGLHIAVMIRSDFFRHSQSRRIVGRPAPLEVYEVVNQVVARQLRLRPFQLPALLDCVGSFGVPAELRKGRASP